MKVIKQSFEILPERTDPIKQIASHARICYKSEDKAKEDERPFLKRIWKHEPIFEMAVVSLSVTCEDEVYSKIKNCKYLQVSKHKSADRWLTLVTGSVRAWQEFIATEVVWVTIKFKVALAKYNKFLFDYDTEDYKHPIAKVVNLDQLDLSEVTFKKHTHVAVKFITNRAVSHELVRHRPCAFLQESQRYCRYQDEVVFIDPRPAFPFFGDQGTRSDRTFSMWENICETTEEVYLQLLAEGASPQAARTVLPNSCKTEIILYASLKEWSHIFHRRTSKAAEPSMLEQMIPLHAKFKEMFPGMFKNPQLSVG